MRVDIGERCRARAGFSTIELLIASVGMVVVLLAMGMLSKGATSALDEKSQAEALTGRLHRVVDQVLDPLMELDSGTLPPIVGWTDVLTYRVPTGWDEAAGAPAWGPDAQLQLEYEGGEADDGVDNDGDGLVDECQLVRTIDPGGAGERRVVLTRGVAEFLEGELPGNLVDDNGNGLDDERGFAIEVEQGVLTLHLTLQRPGDNGLVEETVVSSVRIRN